MHFVSGIEWIYLNGKLESRYDIKSIESFTLDQWSSENRNSEIPLRDGETNIARPWILKEGNKRYMYFSFLRKDVSGYRIGMALEDPQGSWHRLDNKLKFFGLPDDQVMAYPAVIKLMKRRFMFLNGNEYGKYGFYVFELENQV